MKNLTLQLRLASLLVLILLACTAAFGQLTPSGDSYTNTAATTTNYGAQKLLDVESTQTTFIQFDLTAIPSGYTSADITKASLKLYVNAVTTAGSFNVDYVNGTWTESTLDASNAPALGTTIAASVPLITKDKNQYILVDVTTAMQAWLSGTPNDGIALVANSPLNASFDSKENTTTSHPAELDIVFAGGGTLTGITTASGSGLTGGGTSGTLNLSLKACSTNQVLQYNGSSWACAAVGTGTVTSVGSGAGLTGGPITGSGTLSIAPSGVTNAMLANSYAQLGAALNTFTGSALLSGFVEASQAAGPGNAAILGFGTNGSIGTFGSTDTGYGVQGVATSPAAIGVVGLNAAGTGNAVGVYGTSASTAGYAVYGSETAATGSTVGVLGQASSPGGWGVEGSSPFAGVVGINGGFGFWTVGAPYGVLGSNASVAVYGASGGSNTGGNLSPHAAGVWGDYGGAAGTGQGVLGSADDNNAGVFISNGSVTPTIFAENKASAGAVVFEGLVQSTGADMAIGDPGCGSGFMALQLGQGGMSGCNNYTLTGGINGHTYINAVAGAAVHLRISNVDQVVVQNGNTDILGTLTKPAGSFKIDHPLDPANKYLYHSFVESPDMKNMYDGTITTDDAGLATVTLPAWFETLNRDFRYQLTVIGQFAQAIVAGKVANNQFRIQTDKPNVEVSWQVTGTRQDAYANAHRIQVEVEKAPADRGRYLYPEAIGQPATARIGYMPPAPGSEQTAHHQRPSLHSGNASPAQWITLPAPPKLVLPKVAPLSHVARQAHQPVVNQK